MRVLLLLLLSMGCGSAPDSEAGDVGPDQASDTAGRDSADEPSDDSARDSADDEDSAEAREPGRCGARAPVYVVDASYMGLCTAYTGEQWEQAFGVDPDAACPEIDLVACCVTSEGRSSEMVVYYYDATYDDESASTHCGSLGGEFDGL